MVAGIALWLPPRASLARLAAGARFATLELLLARANTARAEGELPRRYFDIGPGTWPAAALTRSLDANDAGDGSWLRADPAFARAELARARLLAIGEIGLSADDADTLRRALAPLFGDEGFELSTPHPARWYLRALTGARLPRFVSATDALGADLNEVLPQGDDAARWHRLLNEAQMLLHVHPINEARAARGLVPVNSLWFWGAGTMPARVVAQCARIASRDVEMLGAAKAARVAACELEALWSSAVAGWSVIDLRGLRDLAALEREVLQPALVALKAARYDTIRVELGSAQTLTLTRGVLRKFWRRPRPLIEEGTP